jgi:hypothetical protein
MPSPVTKRCNDLTPASVGRGFACVPKVCPTVILVRGSVSNAPQPEGQPSATPPRPLTGRSQPAVKSRILCRS